MNKAKLNAENQKLRAANANLLRERNSLLGGNHKFIEIQRTWPKILRHYHRLQVRRRRWRRLCRRIRSMIRRLT